MVMIIEFRARDPEDRIVRPGDRKAKREKMLDKTIADSFPASDPPSSLPDPHDDSFRRKPPAKARGQSRKIKPATVEKV